MCGECASTGHIGQQLLEFSHGECPGAVQSRVWLRKDARSAPVWENHCILMEKCKLGCLCAEMQIEFICIFWIKCCCCAVAEETWIVFIHTSLLGALFWHSPLAVPIYSPFVAGQAEVFLLEKMLFLSKMHCFEAKCMPHFADK